MTLSRLMGPAFVIFFFMIQNFLGIMGLPLELPFFLILVVYSSLAEGTGYGIFMGIICGLVTEPLVLGRVGGESLALALTAWMCSRLSKPFFRDSLFSRFLLPPTAFFFYTGIRILGYRFVGGLDRSAIQISENWFWEVLFVTLASPPIHSFLNHFSGRRQTRNRGKV